MRPELPDLVPAALRREWARRGDYPDLDIYTLFRGWAAVCPDRVAVVDDHGSTSYARLDLLVRQTASGLLALEIEPGDVVAVQLPNGLAAVTCELAIAAVGAVALPVPVGRGKDEVAALLRRSGTAMIIAAAHHRGRFPATVAEELREGLPDLRRVVAVGEDENLALATVASASQRDRPELPRVDPDAAARILVSSGSEAEPKMVAYSHNALAGGRGNFMAELCHDDQVLRAMFLVPLASAFGSNATSVTLARLGGTLVLSRHFQAEETLELITAHRPTHLLGVPTMVRMLLAAGQQHPVAPPDSAESPGESEPVPLSPPALPSLTALVLGGSPLDAATVHAARQAFDCPVVNLYGSADGVNCHTGLAGDPLDTSGPGVAAGKPNPRVADIRIVDFDHNEVPAGQTGEIIARGPMTPMCYVGAPDLDARYRTTGGWVRTGDVGVLTAGGELRVVGRLKDVVIRGGANISPTEVEEHIRSYPGVSDAVCFGVADPLMGERLAAALVVAPDHCPTVEQLGSHLARAGLDAYKHPEHVVAVQQLPLTPAGKVDKDALRAQLPETAPTDT
ncbi:class I adenylate-forming enzyme family protein [Salinactinospora qingdaonensis]|uniref:Acyl-CoA synthetase (AMP-forming)/AMP-acid ligase II n=1 Tax=Salinactinospora qingdaonensis TaxID=702744 RepID=A0ABP7FZT8_9ACTN